MPQRNSETQCCSGLKPGIKSSYPRWVVINATCSNREQMGSKSWLVVRGLRGRDFLTEKWQLEGMFYISLFGNYPCPNTGTVALGNLVQPVDTMSWLGGPVYTHCTDIGPMLGTVTAGLMVGLGLQIGPALDLTLGSQRKGWSQQGAFALYYGWCTRHFECRAPEVPVVLTC